MDITNEAPRRNETSPLERLHESLDRLETSKLERKCSLCGKGPCRLRMAYRSVYPRAPICDHCAGPNPVLATAETDAWAEFHVYPIDAQLPLRPDA